MRALLDGESHHSIDSDRRKQQRQQAKKEHRHRSHTYTGNLFGNDFLNALYVKYRLLLVNGLQLRPDLGSNLLGSPGYAHHQPHGECGILRMRHVDGRSLVAIEHEPLDITHHTHDQCRLGRRRAKPDVLAQRVGARKVSARKFCTDHCNLGRFRAVPISRSHARS